MGYLHSLFLHCQKAQYLQIFESVSVQTTIFFHFPHHNNTSTIQETARILLCTSFSLVPLVTLISIPEPFAFKGFLKLIHCRCQRPLKSDNHTLLSTASSGNFKTILCLMRRYSFPLCEHSQPLILFHCLYHIIFPQQITPQIVHYFHQFVPQPSVTSTHNCRA